MLCCSQHWSPPPLPCIASPACTDSSKALSISRWAVATSVQAANTIQRRLFYHARRQFLEKSDFTADGCLQNNSAYTCTWNATLAMILPSLYHPWWEWSTRCCHQWTPNPLQWRLQAVYRYKSAGTHTNIGRGDTSSGSQQKWEKRPPFHPRDMNQPGSKIRS